MLKTVAFATLLAASCAASAATTWTFSYTGFQDATAGNFVSDYKMEGSFVGDDANGDGFIEKSEITSLLLNNINYISCSADNNEFYYCGADRFSYQIGEKKLDFYVGINGASPDNSVMSGHYFHSGVEEIDYFYSPVDYHQSGYLWTEQTQFQISQGITSGAPLPAVPEPGTWVMLASGLALLAGATARRNRKIAQRLDTPAAA